MLIMETKTMNRISLRLVAIFLLFYSCATKETEAQTEAKENANAPLSQAAEEILAQEKAWAAALVANDMNTVSAIMHRDFRLKRVYGDALPISKDMYLGMEGMSASSAEVTSFEVSKEMGNVAVASVTMTLDWQQEGVGKLPPHFDIIDTWQKNDAGVWQILSRVSQVAEKPYNANE